MHLNVWLPSSNRFKAKALQSLTPQESNVFTAIVLRSLLLHTSSEFLTNHKSIYHTFTSGYDPQASGTAERAVGLVKSLAARVLATAQLDSSYWSYSVRYAVQSLLCHALQRQQRSLPFRSSVVAQELDHKKIKFPDSRTVTGRLLFWDHMQDQVSYILVPPGDDNIDFLVYRASIPARLPPAIKIDELTDADPLPPLPSRPSVFDRSLHDRVAEEEMSRSPLDLDPLPVDRPLHHHDSTDDRSKDSSTHPTLSHDNRRDKDDIHNDKMMTTMSLWNTHPLMHIHLYLLIVHSLFFTYPLRTLLAKIHHMTLIKMPLYQIPLQLGRARRMFQSLPMKC